MKKYIVTMAHPASADVVVEAEDRAHAIEKVKLMLTCGEDFDFSVTLDAPDKLSITAVELDDSRMDLRNFCSADRDVTANDTEDFFLDIVRLIRESHAPDEAIARVLRRITEAVVNDNI